MGPFFTRHRLGRWTLAVVAMGTIVAASSDPAEAVRVVVSGRIFRDLNNDGVAQAGEPGVSGVVVSGAGLNAVSDETGEWELSVPPRPTRLRVSTGWYRSQCDSLNCSAGPGGDNDFGVSNQFIVAAVDGLGEARLDLGLLPDWPGDYPVPTPVAPDLAVAANEVDVAVRVSWVWPSAAGNCFRTNDPRHHGCIVGDTPQALVQVSNEGTTRLDSISGYFEVPLMTSLLPAVASTSPGNSPAITDMRIGEVDPLTQRAPFELIGSLPPAAAAQFVVTARIEPGASLAPLPLRTSNPYPSSELVMRVTSIVDGDGCHVDPCGRGQHDKQGPNDNSDFHGWQVIGGLLRAAPNSLDFGTTRQVTTQAVTISNIGNAATSALSVTVRGDSAGLSIGTSTCDTALAVRGSCQVRVVADPLPALGAQSAELVVTSAGAPDLVVPLTAVMSDPLPFVTGVDRPGARPGTAIVYSGNHLANRDGSPTMIVFTGSSPVAAEASLDGTTLQVAVPADAIQGPVTITTAAGSVVDTSFVVRRAPDEIVLGARAGAVGTTVRISGNNLRGTTAVWFKGTSATFTVINETLISAVVPAGATSGPITVVNPWGSADSPRFTVDP